MSVIGAIIFLIEHETDVNCNERTTNDHWRTPLCVITPTLMNIDWMTINTFDFGAGSGCLADDSGPVFLKEPPNRVDFSNTTGTVIECAATGSPRPDIVWIKADGSPVADVPGLRQVTHNNH